MGDILSREQIHQFSADGFVSGFRVFSPEEAANWLQQITDIEKEQENAHRTGPPGLLTKWGQKIGLMRPTRAWQNRSYRPHEHDQHPLKDLSMALATHPAVTATLADIVGADVLVRNTDIFARETRTRDGVDWHRDIATQGPEVDKMVNLWIALTPSTIANGCVWFLPGGHRLALPEEPTSKHDLNLTPAALKGVDLSGVVPNLLEPGMASVHHMRMIHMSRGNRTTQRRMGVVVRALADSADPRITDCAGGYLVHGEHRSRRTVLSSAIPCSWN